MLHSLKETVTTEGLSFTHSCPNTAATAPSLLLDKSYMVQEKPCLFCGCGLGTAATSAKGERALFLMSRKYREGSMPLVKGVGAVRGSRGLPKWHAAWPVQVYGVVYKALGGGGLLLPHRCLPTAGVGKAWLEILQTWV